MVYSEEDLQNAISAFNAGEIPTLREAARAYSIPYTTLQNRASKQAVPRQRAHTESQHLSPIQK